MKQFTKSETEVLDSINGVKRIAKRLKRHDKAVETLKAKGVIEKGPDNILRLVKTKVFNTDQRGFLIAATRLMMETNFDEVSWKLGFEVLTIVKLLS